MSYFKINHTNCGTAAMAVVDIDGDLDCQTAGDFKDYINGLFVDGVSRIILNFEGVAWLSMTGLGAIVSAYKHCKEMGGDLCMAQLNAEPANRMELTKLNRVISCFETLSEAEQAFTNLVPDESEK
jgi:anti-sigma B factor antagonist